MKEYVKPIDEMVDELAPREQAEVRDFVEFLLAKEKSKQRGEPRFDWAGALKHMREEYNSVDLQHEIARMRSEAE
jgi:hypothetical protein